MNAVLVDIEQWERLHADRSMLASERDSLRSRCRSLEAECVALRRSRRQALERLLRVAGEADARAEMEARA